PNMDSLDYIPKSTAVQFLTAQTNETGRKLTGALRDFKRERPKVEFRTTSASALHDRYVLAKDLLLILGHGLKDIGGTESFMICLPSAYAADLMKEVVTSLDVRWKTATQL